jgi:hypothetical protein
MATVSVHHRAAHDAMGHDAAMDIVLRYSPGCPNWVEADRLLRDALAIVGFTGATLTQEVIETPEEAVAARFTGSPSIFINGVDPFAGARAEFGLACRVYQTPAGLRGSPTLEQLVTVLER